MPTHIDSGTTVANTVYTSTFANWYRSFQIINRGNVDLWVRTDAVDPVIGADDCYVIPAMTYDSEVSNGKPQPQYGTTSNTEIRMISSSACDFTIEVF